MTVRKMAALYATASATCIALISLPAYAQDIPQSATPQAEPQSGGLGDIVVTARKRVENIQDVSASISALSTEDLARRFDSDVRDFANASPNVIIDDTQQGPGGVASVNIRGIGVAEVEKSVDPSVGIVYDEVYIGQTSGALLKAIDIDRVEVLRGPQGTTFGRNATGGVINLGRSRPTYEFTGKARATAARFDTYKLEAVASGGVSDTVALKVSGAYEKSDGYMRNAFYNRPGQRSEFYALGAAVLFEPTDRLELFASYDHQKTKQDPPQLVAINKPTDLFCVAYAQCSPAPGVPTSGSRYTSVSNGRLEKDAFFKLDMAIAKARYDLGGDYDINYIFGWLKTDENAYQDYDSAPFTLYHTDRPAKWRQTTHELRLSKGGGGPLTFVMGAYLWDSAYRIDLKNYIGFAGPALLTSAQTVHQTNKSYAAFFEGDYRFTDRLKLTLGGRYTHDKKSSIVNDGTIFFYDTLVEANPIGSVQGPIVMTKPVKENWSKFTPKASLSYDITDDAMVYLLYSRGYRGGGFNGRPATLNAATVPYDPETLDNFEIGFKSQFLDNRVRLNGAVYMMKYKDMQQDLDVPAPGTSTGRENRTINASKADLNGAELELTAKPIDALTLTGNIGYLDAKYKDFFGDIYSTGTPVDATFLKLRRAPKWTWNLGATYEADIGPGKAWISGSVHYIGGHEITFLNNPNIRNDGQYIVDASINYQIEKTTISVFGKNLTGEDGWSIGYDVQNVWSYAAARPRASWGIAATQTF